MSKRDEERGAIIQPPPVPAELMPAEKAQPKAKPQRPAARSQQLGLDLKPISAAQVIYEKKESVTYSCRTPNFRARISEERIEKLLAEGDDDPRLNILGEWMTPTSRVIYPGEFESERDAIYKRLALEHGLPTIKKAVAKEEAIVGTDAAAAVLDELLADGTTPTLLEG